MDDREVSRVFSHIGLGRAHQKHCRTEREGWHLKEKYIHLEPPEGKGCQCRRSCTIEDFCAQTHPAMSIKPSPKQTGVVAFVRYIPVIYSPQRNSGWRWRIVRYCEFLAASVRGKYTENATKPNGKGSIRRRNTYT